MLMPLVLLPISFYWHIIGNIFSLCSELCDFGQRAWLKGLIKSTLIMVGMCLLVLYYILLFCVKGYFICNFENCATIP